MAEHTAPTKRTSARQAAQRALPTKPQPEAAGSLARARPAKKKTAPKKAVASPKTKSGGAAKSAPKKKGGGELFTSQPLTAATVKGVLTYYTGSHWNQSIDGYETHWSQEKTGKKITVPNGTTLEDAMVGNVAVRRTDVRLCGLP